MNREDVENLESYIGKVISFCKEIGALSKKSPIDAVNKFKLGFINQTLSEVNELLGPSKPFKEFSLFKDDDAPSNSDVLFILAQYAEALDIYRSKHIQKDYNGWHYCIDDGGPQIKTNPPASFRDKG